MGEDLNVAEAWMVTAVLVVPITAAIVMAMLPDVIRAWRGLPSEELVAPPDVACTPLEARWCPLHGPCGCEPEGDLDDPQCPLHSFRSEHAREPDPAEADG